MNRGPRPSDALVEAGAETQTLRKIALPSLKSSSAWKPRLPGLWEKALRWLTLLRDVAPPPGCGSPGSGLEKSCVGRMRSAISSESRGPVAPAPFGPRATRPARSTAAAVGNFFVRPVIVLAHLPFAWAFPQAQAFGRQLPEHDTNQCPHNDSKPGGLLTCSLRKTCDAARCVDRAAPLDRPLGDCRKGYRVS